MRASNSVDKGVVGATRSVQSLGPHGRADLSKKCQVHGIVQCEGRNRCRKCGAVENTEGFFRSERDRLDMVCLEGLTRGNDLASSKRGRAIENANGRVSCQCSRNVRKGRKILA